MTSQPEHVTNDGLRPSSANAKDEQRVDDIAPLSKEDEETVSLVHKRLIQEMDLAAVENLGA